MKHNYLILFIFSLSLFACNYPRKLTKKGKALEEAGMYREAASYYYDALRYNNRYVDAQIGLKTTGQKVLNDYYDEFFKAYHTDKLKDAVYAYRNADKYYNDLKGVGVYLKWDDHYQDDYKDALNRYLETLYTSGLECLKKDDFAPAEKCFKEIMQLDASYKDVKVLQETATLEPLYRAGVDFMNEKKYVKAYDQFNKICSYTCKYKNTESLRAEAREKGTFTIGFFIDDKNPRKLSLQREFAGMISDEINKMNNPFIQLIDRENIEKLLAEQKLGMSGMVDESKAATAGKMIGIQNAFFINILDQSSTQNPVDKQYRKGYEIYNVPYKNAAGESVIKRESTPFNYYEYKSSAAYSFSAELKMVSTETGKILYTRTYTDKMSDEVHYAVPVRTIKLNQAYPTNDVGLYGGSLSSFRSLFTARQELRDAEQLRTDLMRKAARTVAYEVMEYHRQLSYQ